MLITVNSGVSFFNIYIVIHIDVSVLFLNIVTENRRKENSFSSLLIQISKAQPRIEFRRVQKDTPVFFPDSARMAV